MVETGHFATLWKKLAVRLGLKPEFITLPGTCPETGLPVAWRHGVPAERIAQRLHADAGHPALLWVDSISGLASADSCHDDLSFDVTVRGSQKSLMPPPGIGLNALSPRALEPAKTARLPKAFRAWDEIVAMAYFAAHPEPGPDA
jgi:alanine-glyoxylate transaminase/serine-glyoxylate transaminase/serine-pyruvate transaminase